MNTARVIRWAIGTALAAAAALAAAQTAAPTPAPAKVSYPNWARAALRLTGENWKVHKEVIDELKKTPKLETELSEALSNPDLRSLAIDVLVALKMQNFNERLLDLVPRDPDGLIVLALNTLLPPQPTQKSAASRQEATDRYLSFLAQGGLAMPTQIAILDSLGRGKDEIPEETLKNYILSDDADVRRASLNYVRQVWEKHPPQMRHEDWWRLLSPGLSSGPYQTRLQSYQLMVEYRRQFSKEVPLMFTLCRGDKNLEVRRFCHGQEKKS